LYRTEGSFEMKDQELITESPAQANSETALPEPHFDAIAVAIAQPVEPLPPPARRRLPVSRTVLVGVLVAIVGLSTMTFGLTQAYRQINSEEQEAVVTAPEETAITEAPDTANIQVERDLPLRPPVRRPRPRLIVPEGKPVARKVGELVYRNE
jgi:hypothetical protein